MTPVKSAPLHNVLIGLLVLILSILLGFAGLYLFYDYKISPKAFRTVEIDKLEENLILNYDTITQMKVKDYTGHELGFKIKLNEPMSQATSIEILNDIRLVMNSDAFERDISEYYWYKHYDQHSFEVKFVLRREDLYTYYASKGVHGTNLDLVEWSAYNHVTNESSTVKLDE